MKAMFMLNGKRTMGTWSRLFRREMVSVGHSENHPERATERQGTRWFANTTTRRESHSIDIEYLSARLASGTIELRRDHHAPNRVDWPASVCEIKGDFNTGLHPVEMAWVHWSDGTKEICAIARIATTKATSRPKKRGRPAAYDPQEIKLVEGTIKELGGGKGAVTAAAEMLNKPVAEVERIHDAARKRHSRKI